MDEQELVYEEEREEFPRTIDGYDHLEWEEDEYPSQSQTPSYPYEE